MKCLSNLERLNYPRDLVKSLTKLYTFKGKDFYYEDVLKTHMNGIIKNTIERDTFFAAKILGLSITESRIKLIIRKGAEPKNKEEHVLANLKAVFKLIQEKGTDLELTSNEFLQLATKIFYKAREVGYAKEIKIVKEGLLDTQKKISKREVMDQELELYTRAITVLNIEPTQAITNMYVDLLHLNCFTEFNEFIALVIQYCLLFSQRFNVFKYVSFFESYYNRLSEFQGVTAAAGYNWEHGYAETSMLNQATIKLILDGYNEVEGMVADFYFDKKLRKVDNVESIIMKMPGVFTREQIKNQCPQLSDSTINRALNNLKAEGKIAPNGTGRSASWSKLVPDEIFSPKARQYSIFEYLTDEE